MPKYIFCFLKHEHGQCLAWRKVDMHNRYISWNKATLMIDGKKYLEEESFTACQTQLDIKHKKSTYGSRF